MPPLPHVTTSQLDWWQIKQTNLIPRSALEVAQKPDRFNQIPHCVHYHKGHIIMFLHFIGVRRTSRRADGGAVKWRGL